MKLNNDWQNYVGSEFHKSYFQELQRFLMAEYEQKEIYPPQEDIFNALTYTSYQNVKAIILGQDPYHGPNQAHGLSFSVKPGEGIPPSLKNIFQELHEDLGCKIPNNGYLKKWADQGVLLLNTVLTVRRGEANSHKGMGWETFTDEIILSLNKREQPVIFMLWGKPAQSKMRLIDCQRHFIIQSPHPSPLSAHRGFFGSRPFSKVNQILSQLQEEEIDWQIPDI